MPKGPGSVGEDGQWAGVGRGFLSARCVPTAEQARWPRFLLQSASRESIPASARSPSIAAPRAGAR